MNRIIKSEVIVYHDETKKGLVHNIKGHILLFVPRETRIQYPASLFPNQSIILSPWRGLFEEIKVIRTEFAAYHKFHFTDISGNKWTKRNEAEKKVVLKAIEFLKQKGANYNLFCKLAIILYQNPSPNVISDYGGGSKQERKLRFTETVLRMLLKGAVHYLYNYNHKVRVLRIVTDGQPSHRKLSDFRIIGKLLNDVRDYVEICDDAEIMHLPSDHKKHLKESDEYVHANILQLADMLLGSAVYACLGNEALNEICPRINDCVANKKGIIASALKNMLDKKKRGRNFQSSSHYKAFTISNAKIRNGVWAFENIVTKEILIDPHKGQIKLFNSL